MTRPVRERLSLRRDERGLSTVEYVIVLVLIASIAVLTWRTFGNRVLSALNRADLTFSAALESPSADGSPSAGLASSALTNSARASDALSSTSLSIASAALAGSPDAPQPGILERARAYVAESVPAQMALGVATGTAQAIVPGLFLAGSPMPQSPAFEAGRGIAQVVTGGVQLATGIGMAGGGGAAAAGGGLAAPLSGGTTLVLSAVGATVAVQGAAVAGQGLTNMAAGVQTLGNAVAMSGNESSGGGRAAEMSALSKAGQAPDRAGLTKAGRALQKHGGREGSVFPSAKGNPATINQQGQAALDDILVGVSKKAPNKYGGTDYYGGSRGGGARFDGAGNFMGFLEP